MDDGRWEWAFFASTGVAIGLIAGWFLGAWPLGAGVGLLAGTGVAFALSK